MGRIPHAPTRPNFASRAADQDFCEARFWGESLEGGGADFPGVLAGPVDAPFWAEKTRHCQGD